MHEMSDETQFFDTTLRDGHTCRWVEALHTTMRLPIGPAVSTPMPVAWASDGASSRTRGSVNSSSCATAL